MWRMYVRQHPQFGTWYRRVETQPSWVVKSAISLAVLVIVVPLVVLTLAAIVVGLAAFLVLGLIATVINTFRAVFAGGPDAGTPASRAGGRINVRVIDER